MTTTPVMPWLFAALLFVSAAAADAPYEADVDLHIIVNNLGISGRFSKDMKDIRALAASPRESAKLLIQQLRVIPDDVETEKQDSSNMEHILWSLSALRYITGGKEFCSPSKHIFSSSEEEEKRAYWLKLQYGKCLTFFSIWPSRGRIYVAPRDAQARIIAMWRDWYERNAKDYSFRPLVNPKPQELVVELKLERKNGLKVTPFMPRPGLTIASSE